MVVIQFAIQCPAEGLQQRPGPGFDGEEAGIDTLIHRDAVTA